MSIFVIAHTTREFLDTPVFHAGTNGKQEAIAVFTERRLAERYIDDAGWSGEYEVGALEPIQMLRWFTIAHQDGCDMVAINPIRQATLDHAPQPVVDLGEPLTAFAETLKAKLADAAKDAEGRQQTTVESSGLTR